MHLQRFFKDLGKWMWYNAKFSWDGFMGRHIEWAKPYTLFDFRDPNTIKHFDCITDESVGGISTAKFMQSSYGRAVFKGNLSTTVPESSNIQYSGFCGVRSRPRIGLFDKVEVVDLSLFDCLEIKYRGDGRPYFMNIQTQSMVNTNDVYQAFLFTKGGPYWEIERIPFTKFLMTYKGYLQDVQVDFRNIRTLGISINDKKSGSFRLEIEYIKLVQVLHQPFVFNSQKVTHDPRR